MTSCFVDTSIIQVCTKIFLFCFLSGVPCMAINVSVQHNGGFLPGIIILLTQCYHHRGTRSDAEDVFKEKSEYT